jgi:hypothetical protein
MACSYCGGTYCAGACLQVQIQGQAGQLGFQNPGLVGAIGAGAGGAGILQFGSTYNPPTDYGLNEFLGIIADKNDTEACIAFIEKQRQLRDAQVKQLEVIQQQHADNLEKAEKEFMSRCGKYRPSITAELVARIKKMKAFF